ncbi:GntR family transcriptional regulator [Pseudoalteromonas sp. MMG022]|uniref:GntR family transcriptional regulator n=1 Tax=Pseudoalteromonas sp. MMG022 TaxID=2909978 RepID=UPI001EFF70F8|nr:GntR family transcriptional regulator [Pseudoalteromonas sp. MMG022]MCF6436759.1 GntR family transcriptional regulator [Pseudoalteromonas sp. MMG022]
MSDAENLLLEKRLRVFLDKDHALRDIIGYLCQNYNVGDKIPSERDLDIEVGYSRTKVREALIRLDCFGYIDISHGKANRLLKSFKAVLE